MGDLICPVCGVGVFEEWTEETPNGIIIKYSSCKNCREMADKAEEEMKMNSYCPKEEYRKT